MEYTDKLLVKELFIKPLVWGLLITLLLEGLMILFSWYPTFWNILPFYKKGLIITIIYCLCKLTGAAFKQ